jgi:subtilisin
MRQIRINFLVLCLPLLAWGLIAAIPAAAQQNGRVNVLIGFDRTPGPNERALVRTTGGSIRFSYHLLPSIAANVPEAALAGLLRNPRVTMIEPDGKIFAIDAELDSSWGVKRIGAGNVHTTNEGAGVTVAIIDS